MNRRKKLILCADDYAITPKVSLGIRELIEKSRISATSIMMGSEYAEEELEKLKPYFNEIDVGIHLTLTEQPSITHHQSLAPNQLLPSFKALAKSAFLRTLTIDEIYDELEQQIKKFITLSGRIPDYLDGHHHIHILPQIRDIVIELFQKHLDQESCYIRSCFDKTQHIFAKKNAIIKSLIIGNFLSARQNKLLLQSAIHTNQGFSGVYDLNTKKTFSDVFHDTLLVIENNALMMCHPGYSDDILAKKDSMTTRRDTELAFLLSDAFPEMLAENNTYLGRLLK